MLRDVKLARVRSLSSFVWTAMRFAISGYLSAYASNTTCALSPNVTPRSLARAQKLSCSPRKDGGTCCCGCFAVFGGQPETER